MGRAPASCILTSKCDACANAAMGGVTLCAGLRVPICQSAGRSRKDLNHCPTRVNITANRLEVPAVGDSLYNGFISND